MKSWTGILGLLLLVGSTSALRCYNCTSFKQQSSCGEKDPLTEYLTTTRCSTSCYKWILYSNGNEVRRGCKILGMVPPASSYAEYLCSQNLCNAATPVSLPGATIAVGIATTTVYYLGRF